MSIKRWIAGTVLAIAVALPITAVVAYSPDRQTYTCNSAGQCVGANHVQFNSFTNNPAYGDERNFLTVRDSAAATTAYTDNQAVVAGKEYVLRFYVHNNAQQSLAGADNYVAKDTKVRVALPSTVNGNAQVNGYISASNANPGTVSDDVTLTGSNLKLEYVAGSAKIRTNGLNDVTLSDSIVGSGAPVGYDALNGNWPGCFEFSGWVTLKVKVVAPPAPQVKFACTKLDAVQVSRSRYDFVATATAENATIQSYTFTTKNSSGNIVDTKTVNTSALSANYTFDQSAADAYLVSAVVNTDKGSTNPADCTKQVKVEPPTPEVKFACSGLDATQVSRTQFDFTAHAMVQNTNVKSYNFVAKNASGNVVDSKTVTTNATSADYVFDQSDAGDYTVSAVVNTDNGSTNPADCKKTVTVKEKPVTPVYSCKALTVTAGANRSITATVDYQADGGAKLTSVTYDFGDGSTPLLSGKTTVNYTYAKDGNYVVTATLAFNVNEVIKTVRCTASVSITTPVTPTPTPTPPAPLPNTGPGEVAGLFAGVSALGAAGHYIVARRRQ